MRTALSLAVLTLAAVTWAQDPQPPKDRRRSVPAQAEASLADLVRDIVTAGPGETVAEGETARDLDLRPGALARYLSSPAAQAEDGRSRRALVFMEPVGRGGKPLALVLFARKDDAKGKAVERLWLKLDLDGRLLKVRRVAGPADKKAKPAFPDPKSKQSLELRQRELDFWLKGVGHRRK
ncbi:MAG: hypothetical protein WC943_07185 [Elusimicrobiota bacterium]|jgi:hypothetical protein